MLRSSPWTAALLASRRGTLEIGHLQTLITLSWRHACSIWTNQMRSSLFTTAINLRYSDFRAISFTSVQFPAAFCQCFVYISANKFEFDKGHLANEKVRIEGLFLVTGAFKITFTALGLLNKVGLF